MLVNTAKPTCNKQTLFFPPPTSAPSSLSSPSHSCQLHITARCLHKIFNQPLSLRFCQFIHLYSPLLVKGKSKVCDCLHSCPQIHPLLLLCPLPLFLCVAPPFCLFPPYSSSLLPPSADNVNTPPFSSFRSPFLTQFSPRCLIRQDANERPVEGAPRLVPTTSLPDYANWANARPS